jgi:uncharacterized RDD family membrane protein YckC
VTWYYANGGQQLGPVDEAALDDLVRQGVVRSETLVWKAGMPAWQPHGTARPQAAAPPPEMRFCSECGRQFPVNQLSNVSGSLICGSCYPAYQQRMTPQPAAAYPGGGGGYQPQPQYQPAAQPFQPGYQPGYQPGAPMGGAGAAPAYVTGWRYGGFWMRFLARIIDAIIVGIASAIIRIPLALVGIGGMAGLSTGDDPAAALAALPLVFAMVGIGFVIQIALGVIYEVYFLTTRGATLGKIALGLKVVRADGGPITTGLALGRYFASWLSGMILMIGYIMAGFDEEKRALHDRICDTRVIYAK